MPKTIDSFQGEYSFLSNFYFSALIYAKKAWLTSEHAYQASKTRDKKMRQIIRDSPTPGEAKRLGRYAISQLRDDWDSVRIDIMTEIVRAKFKQNKRLRKMLVATKNATLIEGNTWGDRFWGQVEGVGENHLGKILMLVRSEFLTVDKKELK